MGDSSENNNVLQNRWPEKKSEQLSLRTDVEKIILFQQGKIPNAHMTEALEQKMNRMKQTTLIIQKYGGAKKVIPILQDLFDISFSQANRLYQDTQLAYGALTHFNRPYHIDTYIQLLLEGIQLAKNSGDLRTYQGLMKDYREAIKEFMGTNEADLYKKLQIPEYKVGFFPEELKTKLPKDFKSRMKKLLEAKRKDEIEDAIVLDSNDGNEEDPL